MLIVFNYITLVYLTQSLKRQKLFCLSLVQFPSFILQFNFGQLSVSMVLFFYWDQHLRNSTPVLIGIKLQSQRLFSCGSFISEHLCDRFSKVHSRRCSLTPLGSIVFFQGSGSNIDQWNVKTNKHSTNNSNAIGSNFLIRKNKLKSKILFVCVIVDY